MMGRKLAAVLGDQAQVVSCTPGPAASPLWKEFRAAAIIVPLSTLLFPSVEVASITPTWCGLKTWEAPLGAGAYMKHTDRFVYWRQFVHRERTAPADARSDANVQDLWLRLHKHLGTAVDTAFELSE